MNSGYLYWGVYVEDIAKHDICIFWHVTGVCSCLDHVAMSRGKLTKRMREIDIEIASGDGYIYSERMYLGQGWVFRY